MSSTRTVIKGWFILSETIISLFKNTHTMGLIKDANGANVSVAAINGYTKENVIKAKRYLREIGNDRRNFPI